MLWRLGTEDFVFLCTHTSTTESSFENRDFVLFFLEMIVFEDATAHV